MKTEGFDKTIAFVMSLTETIFQITQKHKSFRMRLFMSLYKYKVDLSALTLEEKSNLYDCIDTKSYNGFFFDPISGCPHM